MSDGASSAGAAIARSSSRQACKNLGPVPVYEAAIAARTEIAARLAASEDDAWPFVVTGMVKAAVWLGPLHIHRSGR